MCARGVLLHTSLGETSQPDGRVTGKDEGIKQTKMEDEICPFWCIYIVTHIALPRCRIDMRTHYVIPGRSAGLPEMRLVLISTSLPNYSFWIDVDQT